MKKYIYFILLLNFTNSFQFNNSINKLSTEWCILINILTELIDQMELCVYLKLCSTNK